MDMFVVLKGIHNILRWVVLLSGLWALIAVTSGYITKRAWTDRDRLAGLVFSSVLGAQVVLGLVLYGISPLMRSAMRDPSLATNDFMGVGFFFYYHIAVMLLAMAAVQTGYSMSKRIPVDRIRFRIAFILYLVGMLLIFLAIPWGFRPNWPSYLFG